MNNKKAEMGMGTLIIFIAMILVAAIAASVLISTTVKLQNKALDTGKMTTNEVGTSLNSVEVYAENATADNAVECFYETIKLAAGSEPIRFTDVLLTLSLSDDSQDYSYNNGGNCNTRICRVGGTIFNVTYQIQGTSYSPGYLNKGDVAKVCWPSPRSVGESEDVKITLVPKVGSILVVETTTPDLMVDQRIAIYP
jgi:archaeal flagellin FlaB